MVEAEEEFASISANQYVELKRSGLAIAKTRWELLNKETWSEDDYNWFKLWCVDIQRYEGIPQAQQRGNWLSLMDDITNEEHLFNDNIYALISNRNEVTKLKNWLQMAFTKKMWQTFHPVERTAVLSYRRPSPINYYDLSNEYWIRWMAGGSTGIALGEKGSGKTAGFLLLAEKAIQQSQINNNYTEEGERYPVYPNSIITNIKVTKEYPFIKKFRSTGEMYLLMIDNALLKRHTLCIIDEMTVAGGRKKTTMAKFMTNLDKVDRLTRKLGTDMCYIWHKDTEIPTEFYGSCSFILHKHGSKEHKSQRKYATIEKSVGTSKVQVQGSSKTVDRKIDYVTNFPVPGTTWEYDTYDIAPYDSTIQITEIISEMATYEGMTFDEELEGVRSFVASKLGDKDFEPPKEEDTEEEKDNEKESVEEDERPVNQKVVMKEKV